MILPPIFKKRRNEQVTFFERSPETRRETTLLGRHRGASTDAARYWKKEKERVNPCPRGSKPHLQPA